MPSIPPQTLDFTWIDARGRTRFESYAGSLGVAPQWATGPLGERGERMVSACIAARVNHYGVPVRISLRSQRAPLHVIGDGELEAFPVVEGAFWGNLWADPPYLFACHVGENAEHARETQRACAAGHLREDGTVEGCGMIQILGDCSALCRSFDDAGQHYSKCADVAGDGRVTHDVITTALP
ncbi:MAG: hypothetical protein H6705_13295 [Myxococcales bacterium]|nr:hypothetical protein [Myxococcales bacterium]